MLKIYLATRSMGTEGVAPHHQDHFLTTMIIKFQKWKHIKTGVFTYLSSNVKITPPSSVPEAFSGDICEDLLVILLCNLNW